MPPVGDPQQRRRPRKRAAAPKRQPRSTALQPLGKQGPALQTQVRQAHRRVRRAEAKLPGPTVPLKRYPHLKTYTPAQRHTILREQTRAITHEVAKARRQGGTPAAAKRMQEINQAANLGEKITRQALHQYAGLQQTNERRRPTVATGTNAGNYAGTTYRTQHHEGLADTLGIGKLPVLGKGLNTTGKVLDFVARPLHATAGAALALQTHGSVTDALSRGIKGQSRTTYSDVLGAGGVKGPAKYIAGFGADVVGDPLNLATFGAATPVKVLEESAAAARRGAEVAYAARQLGKAEKLTQRAERLEAQIPKAAANKGLRVGIRTPVGSRGRSMDLPLVTRATAAASKVSGLSAAATHLREGESLPARATQALGKVFAPDMRPRGVSEAEWRKTLDAEREARAESRIGVRTAERRGQAYAKAVTPEEGRAIVDAIERAPRDPSATKEIRQRIATIRSQVESTENPSDALLAQLHHAEDELHGMAVPTHSINALPEHLRSIAVQARKELRDVGVKEQQAGLIGALRQGYVPHQWTESLGEKVRARVGQPGRETRNQFARRRKLEGSISEINAHAEADGIGAIFDDSLPALVAARTGKSAKIMAQHHFQQRLANEEIARSIKPGEVGRYLDEHPQDSLFTMGKDGIKPLETNKGVPDLKAASEAAKQGQPVFGMNRLIGQRYTQGYGKIATTEGPSVGRGFDRFTSGMKTLFTVFNIPAYDLRNLTGDLFNAYLADTTSKDILDGFRAMAVQAKRHGAELTLDKQFTSKATVSLGRGQRISMEEALKRAEASGAIQTGYVGAEKFEVVRGTEDTGIRTVFNRPQPIEKLRGISQVREDGVRLGTWLGAKRRGMTDSEAARWANQHHFDYADLTDAERSVMRRVFPFYTFVARNTRLQGTKLLTNPGKYANYQALREESSKHAGLGPDWESHLAPYQQRAGGIPFSLPGEKGARMAYPALPLTDISRLAAFGSGDSAASFDLAAQNVNPLIKSPVEYLMNHSTFFRAPIYRDENNPDARKWVPAPPVIASNPALRRALGLKQIPDPNNKNKPTWMWSAKTDFWARQTPQTNFALQALTPTTGSHGQSSKMALASQLSGVKFGNYDRVKVELTEAQKHMRELRVKQNDMGDEGTDRSGPDKGHYSHAYRKLLDDINATQKRIDKLKKKQGKAGKKPRVSSSKGGGGGGSYGAPSGGGGSYGAPSGGGGTYGL